MLPVVTIISAPQSVTGAWEQTVAPLKVAGIDIAIRTTAQQRIDYVWVTTYMRRWGHSQRTQWSSQLPGRFSWQNNILLLHEQSTLDQGQPVNLDLTFDPKRSEWRGQMQSEWYAGNVVLKRPFVPHVGYAIVGDWMWGDPDEYTCKHIALGADSSLVIWSDEVDKNATNEWYGDLDMDPEEKDIGTNMLFFTGTDLGGDVVMGRVNQKGDAFEGQSAHFGNGLTNGKFNPMTWHRTTPDCNKETASSKIMREAPGVKAPPIFA